MSIKRKQKIVGGTKTHPYFKDYGPYLCLKCNVEVTKIKVDKRSSSEVTDRGKLNRRWEETLYRCPKCNKEETIHGYVHESDGSYYSNEERRVYNISVGHSGNRKRGKCNKRFEIKEA